MLIQPLYIDVMLNGSFVCQVTYTGGGRTETHEGQFLQVLSGKNIKKFIEHEHPELKDKPFNIAFSTQPLLSGNKRHYEHRTLRH